MKKTSLKYLLVLTMLEYTFENIILKNMNQNMIRKKV